MCFWRHRSVDDVLPCVPLLRSADPSRNIRTQRDSSGNLWVPRAPACRMPQGGETLAGLVPPSASVAADDRTEDRLVNFLLAVIALSKSVLIV